MNEEKESTLKLYHFGEALVGRIIEKLKIENFLKFLEKKGFCPRKNSVDAKTEQLHILGEIKEIFKLNSFKVKTLAKIKSRHETKFEVDTEHSVDIALFSESKVCFPIEVKMGHKGVVGSWARFQAYMKKGAIKERDYKENATKRYLDGAMSSFLANHKNVEHENYQVVILNDGQEFTFDKWCLCIRRDNIKGFLEPQVKKEFIQNVPIIFTFEDLVEFYKSPENGGTDEGLKELVEKILEDSKLALEKEIAKALNHLSS